MGADSILILLLLLIVALWAAAYFGGNWQLNRNMRNYDEVFDADMSTVLALAAKGLKGRNPLATVTTTRNACERVIEKTVSAGPTKGGRVVAIARVECTQVSPGRTRVVASNDVKYSTWMGAPVSLTPITASRRAIDRAMKLIAGAQSSVRA